MPKHKLNINADITVEVYKDEETGIWISRSPDLDLYSQGNTEEEALEALRLGMNTHLKVCYERGHEICLSYKDEGSVTRAVEGQPGSWTLSKE